MGLYTKSIVHSDLKVVNDIHKFGRIILGTTRNGYDTSKIVDNIQDRGINQICVKIIVIFMIVVNKILSVIMIKTHQFN